MSLQCTHSSFQGLIGVARRDITPPIGIYARNWGVLPNGLTTTGTHLPLLATATVFRASADDAPLALVAVDGSWFKDPADERDLIRGPALEALKLPEANLIIAYSHTHVGCSLSSSESVHPGGEKIVPYMQYISQQVVDAVREALARSQTATLTWTTGRCGLACNRDQTDPSGGRFIVGYNAHGNADDTLLVGRITRDDDGQILSTLVNYACHPISLGWQHTVVSPDFVGPMRGLVEQRTGGAPCLFLQGASGDLSPRRQYSGDIECCEQNGRQLGYAALSAIESMLHPRHELRYDRTVESGAPLGIWTQSPIEPSRALEAKMIQVSFPLKQRGSAEEIERQAASADATTRERLLRALRIGKFVGFGKTCSMPAWVWRLGDALIVAQPNEAYQRLQTTLRGAFSDAAVAVMNVANGWCGYLPPSDFYGNDAYSVWQTPFAAGALEELIRTIDTTARALCGKNVSPE